MDKRLRSPNYPALSLPDAIEKVVALYRAQLDVREASLIRAAFIEVRKFLHRKRVLNEVGPVGSVRKVPVDDSQSATLGVSDAP